MSDFTSDFWSYYVGILSIVSILACAALLMAMSKQTVKKDAQGKTLSTDGPYAETKEQLGGYYLIEAKDLDEATKIAAKIPGALFGAIEVRPVRAMPADYPRPQ